VARALRQAPILATRRPPKKIIDEQDKDFQATSKARISPRGIRARGELKVQRFDDQEGFK
jgi:hypothetical protein